MSRIGKKIIKIESNVTVNVTSTNLVTVKGPKGELTKQFTPLVNIVCENNEIKVTLKNANDTEHFAMYGTTNALISNMVEGVSKGFKKQLNIVGVGYRGVLKGNLLVLSLGYSHPVELAVPKGLKVELPKVTEIVITGIDKEEVGHFAALIRSKKLPEPYLGKGILYSDEKIIRKEGKAAGK